jgi:integrase/recombinase XerD
VPYTVRDVITGFLRYVMVERGPARSTQAGYGRDVQQFFVWQRQQGCDATVDQLTRPAVLQFLEARQQHEWSMRSIARTHTALRMFDRWLAVGGLRPARASADMHVTWARRSRPRTLSQEGIEALLQQPSRVTPIGLRDLAMLEVLYGVGLRVAELVTLPMSALHLLEGWLKVRGKGSRGKAWQLTE